MNRPKLLLTAAGLGIAAAALAGPTEPVAPTPQLFAPGVIGTGDIEFAPAFEPDGRTVYFSKGSPGQKRVMWIMVSRLAGGRWTTPEIAPFSGRYSDIDPTISPDGRSLYFASTRPTEGTEPKKDFDLWVADKTDSGWGEPRNLGAPVNSAGSETTTSVTADGTLYIGAGGREAGGRTGRRLYRSKRVDGKYQAPEPLPAPIDGGEEDSNQYVSTDGRFMIFLSKRSGAEAALYVAYFENGAWSVPESIGAKLNADYSPYTPLISPDGKTFYFTSVRGVFDRPPIASMSYANFLDAIRSPGNGLGDIYSVGIKALSLRPGR